MEKILQDRLDKIKAFIDNGYVADLEKGIVYSPSKHRENKELKPRGSLNQGYVKITTRMNGVRVHIGVHQLIYYLATGKVVHEVDHINRIKHDNRIINLREATDFDNSRNRMSFKGYSQRKDNNKFRAAICIRNVVIELGNFDTEEEAASAYLEAKKKYHIIGDENAVTTALKEKLDKNPKGFKWNRKPAKGYYYQSKHRGVNKWTVYIKVMGKSTYVGNFFTEEEAKNAYQEAKIKYDVL